MTVVETVLFVPLTVPFGVCGTLLERPGDPLNGKVPYVRHSKG